PGPRGDLTAAQRQLRLVERDRVLPVQVGGAVRERDDRAAIVEAAGDHRLGRAGKPDPCEDAGTGHGQKSSSTAGRRTRSGSAERSAPTRFRSAALVDGSPWSGTPTTDAASNAVPRATVGSPCSTLRIVTG